MTATTKRTASHQTNLRDTIPVHLIFFFLGGGGGDTHIMQKRQGGAPEQLLPQTPAPNTPASNILPNNITSACYVHLGKGGG